MSRRKFECWLWAGFALGATVWAAASPARAVAPAVAAGMIPPASAGRGPRAGDVAATLLLLGMMGAQKREKRSSEGETGSGGRRDMDLLDHLPVQVLEEDLSAFPEIFARLRGEGVTDMVSFLADHPRLSRDWLGRMRLIRANAQAIKAAGYASDEDMIARFASEAGAPHLEIFNYQVAALWAGRRVFEEEFRYLDARGLERACLMRCSMIDQPGQPEWSRVILVLLDTTGAKRTVAAKMEDQALLRSILARANILLWWAQVRREDGRYRWKINVPSQSFDSPIYRLATAIDRGGLWDNEHVPDLAQVTLITEQALRDGAPGYQHEIRVLDADGRTHWVSEEVGISRLAEDEWSLIGVASEVTARHEAEEAREASEAQLQQILARADCMLWRANVARDGARTQWSDFNLPTSGLYTRLRNAGIIPADGRLWPKEYVSARAEMDERSQQAVFSGAPGYEQEFHVVKDQLSFWMHEQVMITPAGPDKWNLVGVLMDVTAQHEAEEARRRSQTMLQQLLTRADCLLWQANIVREGTGVRWRNFGMPSSVLYQRLFGGDHPASETGLWLPADTPELPEMNRRSTEAILSGAPGYEQEFRLIRPERTLWLHEQVSITAIGPDEWNLVGVLIDVTARHEAEEAHRASEAQLRQILARADCLLWQARVNENERGVLNWDLFIPQSILYQQLFGGHPAEHPSLMWSELDVPEMATMNVRSTAAIRAGAPGYEQEFRATRQGRTYWLYEQVSITRIGPREWTLVGVITDISARREAEAALAAEKERLVVTLGTMAEAVITTDTQGVVQYVNRAATDFLQGGGATLVHRSLADLCTLQNASTGQIVDLPVVQVLREPGTVDLPPHTSLVSRFGTRRLIAGTCATIHGTDGSVAGTVFVFRDVTERERLEQELARSSKLESLGVLAGGIAHDFNNILTAIMGNLALALLDAGEVVKVEQCLREAERATMRARDLTQQLLTFSKGGDPVRGSVLLPEILQEVAQFALHGSRSRCEFDLPSDLWPADADRGQVGQVVQNLVINASQAMPEGGIVRISAANRTVTGGGHPVLAGGPYVRITVADSGTGIRPEHLPKIFDPYFTTKQEGSGLGLATVYSIVKKHKGHIEVESELGRGTTFHIWLPALHGRPPETRPGRPGALPSLKGRVLLMDDEKIIRQMTNHLLKRLGLEVELANDGAEAVQKFIDARSAGRSFDLLVMDLTVPGGMGGREALEEIRRHDPAIRAIVSSGYASDPIMANFRQHGFQGVVAKPYRIEDFIRVVHEVLEAGPST
jgi:signal transduction histidine kinase/ActR/RegA family two-component response regulator